MSKPNRTKVLIGFGVVAIVLVAGLAFWPPNFPKEEASGAIGVVKKHHEAQIARPDVILGNEKTAKKQRVLYGDFLRDAAKIQNLSASIVANKELGNLNVAVDALENELANQYADQMMSSLASMEIAAKSGNQIELANDIAELASDVKANAEQLSVAEMHEFNDKFANISAQSKEINNIEMANQELASALASHDATQAGSHIDNAEELLSNFDLANISLADQQEYFANIEAAANSLAVVNLESKEMSNRLGVADTLADRADALAEAAMANIQEQVQSSIELASALHELSSKEAGIVSEYANHDLANEVQLAQQEFASQTASSFQAELAAMDEFAANKEQFNKLGNDASLASMIGNQELASQLFNQLANTEALAHTAELMNQSLANQELANALNNEEQLSNQAEALASKYDN